VPKKIGNKIKVKYYDCHSNNTNYPWCNKIVAGFLEGHINEGKQNLILALLAVIQKED
jgi:hypothetical protein